MNIVEEHYVVEAGRGGKVTHSFTSGMIVTFKKRRYPILVTAQHENKNSILFFRRIDETFEVDDIDSLVVGDHRGTDEQEAFKAKRKK